MRRIHSMLLLATLVAGGCQARTDSSAGSAAASSPARPKPRADAAAIPAGTVLPLKLETGISSASSRVGELVVARLSEDVRIGDRLLLARGTELRGRVSAAVPSGRVKGRARLAFGFDTLVAGGRETPIEVAQADITAGSNKGEDAKVIGGGAAAGLLIGALADGKKGAAIGTAVGAAAGTGVVLATGGKEVELPAGTALRVKLERELLL